MNHSSTFSFRLRKEQLIHKTDTLIGSVPIIGGQLDKRASQEVEGKMAVLRLSRGAVFKTWTNGNTVEYYLSTRVSRE